MKPRPDGATVQRDIVAYSVRNKKRRIVPFDELDVAHLAPRQREVLGRDWRHRMQQEHLAVGGFAFVATELAKTGSSEIVLSLVTRAASDEVAHAEVCRRLASAFLGSELPRSCVGSPIIPSYPSISPSTRALLHMVEMCCISESLTTCFFTEAVARVAPGPVREALELLLEDELDHGRVGWAHLADADAGGRASVAVALPSMLERMVGWLPTAMKQKRVGDKQLEAYGYLMPDTVIELYRASLRDVVLRGFETLGVDVTSAHRYAKTRGIL